MGDDPELLDKVVPDYVCLGKRTLQDNGSWLAALTRPDVELVTDPIDHITETGLVGDSGTEYPADVIVYATGFDTQGHHTDQRVTGPGGRRLADVLGPLALVLVGAMLVSSMETVWAGTITPPYGRKITHGDWSRRDIRLQRGEEMGRFNMGSTVILATVVAVDASSAAAERARRLDFRVRTLDLLRSLDAAT